MNDENGKPESCPLCGFKFSTKEVKCSVCPLNKNCRVLCCPHCGYQMIDESKTRETISKIWGGLQWLKKIILKKKR